MRINTHSQRGVSLIESLIAMVILAFSMMSLAGMQARMLVDSRTANLRAIAIGHIDDLTNRMTINRNAAIGLPNATPPVPSAYELDWGNEKTEETCTNNSTGNAIGNCTATQLAQADLFEWRKRLSESIPGANAKIFQSPNDFRQIGIAIAWPINTSALLKDNASNTKLFSLNELEHGVDCPTNRICHLIYVQP